MLRAGPHNPSALSSRASSMPAEARQRGGDASGAPLLPRRVPCCRCSCSSSAASWRRECKGRKEGAPSRSGFGAGAPSGHTASVCTCGWRGGWVGEPGAWVGGLEDCHAQGGCRLPPAQLPLD